MWCFCSKFQTHFGSKNWMDGWMIKGWKQILALKSVGNHILHQPPNLDVFVLIFSWKKDGPLFRHLPKKNRALVNSAPKPFFLDQLHLRFLDRHIALRSDPIRKSPGDVVFFFRKGQTWPAQWLPRAFGDVSFLGGEGTRSRDRDIGDASEIRRLHQLIWEISPVFIGFQHHVGWFFRRISEASTVCFFRFSVVEFGGRGRSTKNAGKLVHPPKVARCWCGCAFLVGFGVGKFGQTKSSNKKASAKPLENSQVLSLKPTVCPWK